MIGERLAAIRQMFLLEAVIAVPLMAGGFLLAGSRGVVVGLLLALMIESLAWLCSRPILVRICSATPVSDGEHPQLVEAVGRIAMAAGLPMPQVAVSTMPIPNAMAAVTPGGGLVCVTEGLLGMLSPAELEAVLAHEIAHLTQPGRAGATIAALFASVPGAITAAAGSDLYFELPYRRAQVRVWGGGKMHPLRDLIARATAPLAAILVRLSTSPASEFAADARAVRIIDDPATLALALRKLQSLAGRIVWPVNPAIAHLLVIHPFGCPRLGQLFNTHPSTPDRLAALHVPTR